MNLCQLVVYIPETHTDLVKDVLFAAGAGEYDGYDCCAWQVSGKGQFRPCDGATPFLGRVGEVESVIEDRVEMLCRTEKLGTIIRALRDSHPYDVPAYHVLPLLNPDDFSSGR